VLSVNANWSNGTVGNGCIYRGNLGLDDACGYNGADPESGTGRNAKASLTLTNSQVIWDLAGNVWEWTAGQTTAGQPGMTGESAYAWKSWMSITAAGTLSPNVTPASTGITGSSTWVGGKEGIGILYSKASDATLRGFLRGGNYSHGIFSAFAGVMYLNLSAEPTNIDSSFGFRVSR